MGALVSYARSREDCFQGLFRRLLCVEARAVKRSCRAFSSHCDASSLSSSLIYDLPPIENLCNDMVCCSPPLPDFGWGVYQDVHGTRVRRKQQANWGSPFVAR